MSKIVILNRKKIQMYSVIAAIIILAGAYIGWQQTRPAIALVGDQTKPRVVQLITVEFTSTNNGKKLEAYQFSPSTVPLKKGELVELRISGINGQSHPFVIEGLNISGEIHKGKTTVVQFTPKEAGIYPIICQTHSDLQSNGPMVGYLDVR